MGNQLDLNSFLGHSTRSSDGSQFLRGWRKRNPPAVNVFLHPGAPIIAIWQHGLPHIYEREDDQTRKVTRNVGGGVWNCLESEDTLRKQYRRDDDGQRIAPPQLCPLCKLIEVVRTMIDTGDLTFCAPLFKWEGSDPTKAQIVTAGGLINAYGRKDLTEDEVAQMRAAGIRASEGWKESLIAKCNYLFQVIDADEVDAGVQIAIETTSLGDHVKEVIKGQMIAMGEVDGNPILKPYAIRWEHHPNEKEFQKKYKAIAMPRIKVTAAIRALFDEDPPTVDHIVTPGNVATLRAELEAKSLVDLPWDDIFGAAEAAAEADAPKPASTKPKGKRKGKGKGKPKPPPPPEPDDDADDEGDEADDEAPPPKQKRKQKPKPEPKPKPKRKQKPKAKPQIACDECGKMMDEDATVCPHCGAEYELEDEDDAEDDVDDTQAEPGDVDDDDADDDDEGDDEDDSDDEDDADDDDDDIPF